MSWSGHILKAHWITATVGIETRTLQGTDRNWGWNHQLQGIKSVYLAPSSSSGENDDGPMDRSMIFPANLQRISVGITFFWAYWHTQPLGNEASRTQDGSIPCKKVHRFSPQNRMSLYFPFWSATPEVVKRRFNPLIYCDFDLGDLFRSPERLVSNSNVAISRTIVHSFIHHQVSTFETHIPQHVQKIGVWAQQNPDLQVAGPQLNCIGRVYGGEV